MSVDPGLSASVEGAPVPPPGPAAPAQARQNATQRAARPRGRAAVPAAVAGPAAAATRRPDGRGAPRVGRRVKRVVRRIDLWSVLKVALVFNTIMLVICLGAVAVLWGLASTTGLVDDLEGFLRDSGFEDFRFDGDRMFLQVAIIGAVLTLASTVLIVLATALLNLISEVTGGIRFTVIEEVVPPAAAGAAPVATPAAAPPPVAAPPRPAPVRRPSPGPASAPPTPATPPAAAAPPAARTEPPRGPGGSPAGGIVP